MKKSMLTLAAFGMVLLALWLQTGCSEDDDVTTPGDTTCSIQTVTPRAGQEFQTVHWVVDGEGDSTLVSQADIVEIRWDGTSAASNVTIELLKGGNVLGQINEAVSNDGYQPWYATTMGFVSADDYAIRIAGVGYEDCADTTGDFTIINLSGCDFDITYPVPGTSDLQVTAGDILTITWDSQDTGNDTDIELMRGEDEVVGVIATSIQDDGFYDWTVDSFHEGSGTYWLRVSDGYADNCSDASGEFYMTDDVLCSVVISAPQAGETWNQGETHTIRWFTENSGDYVDIHLRYGSTYVGTITQYEDAAAGEFDWTVDLTGFDVPDGATSFRIEIEDSYDGYCSGLSPEVTIPATK